MRSVKCSFKGSFKGSCKGSVKSWISGFRYEFVYLSSGVDTLYTFGIILPTIELKVYTFGFRV